MPTPQSRSFGAPPPPDPEDVLEQQYTDYINEYFRTTFLTDLIAKLSADENAPLPDKPEMTPFERVRRWLTGEGLST